MGKPFLKFITLFAVFSVGCFSSQLKKTDINQLPDKKFYLTSVKAVISEHKLSSKKDVVLDSTVPKDICKTIPVEGIFKVLSEELKIEGDFSEFKSIDLDAFDGCWKSDKTNVNSISISYNLNPYYTDKGLYFISYYLINIKTASGASRTFYLRSPEEGAFVPQDVATKRGMKVEDVIKILIIADVKNMPVRLEKAIKTDMQ